jgi:hypothetical protein
MIEQIQYKNYILTLKPQIKNDMKLCLEKDNAIDIIAHILKIAKKQGYSLDSFNRVSCLIRNLFFAMNPTQDEYEKVRLFFEYSNCITNDIPTETFDQLEMAIYTILSTLRNIFFQETN